MIVIIIRGREGSEIIIGNHQIGKEVEEERKAIELLCRLTVMIVNT
jgi:hypothetical protein